MVNWTINGYAQGRLVGSKDFVDYSSHLFQKEIGQSLRCRCK